MRNIEPMRDFTQPPTPVVPKDKSVWNPTRNGVRCFDALRVLNNDRVAPMSHFVFHTHRDAEIFSYILTGELTHRDSMMGNGATGSSKDQFYRIRRGDEQVTTGGTGISQSEENEHATTQIYLLHSRYVSVIKFILMRVIPLCEPRTVFNTKYLL